ncbi:hypothetical protein B0H13DRAFT_2682582 [Mycena leptocephala]|nr:hypothetical protein B0H13DRAFT_2682582 [Mycena leptocephala]
MFVIRDRRWMRAELALASAASQPQATLHPRNAQFSPHRGHTRSVLPISISTTGPPTHRVQSRWRPSRHSFHAPIAIHHLQVPFKGFSATDFPGRNQGQLPCKYPHDPADRAQLIASSFPSFPETLLPLYFSSEWAKYSNVYLFCIKHERQDVSLVDILIRSFNIPVPMRPLAFRNSASLEALTHFGGGFASDEDFFSRLSAVNDISSLGTVEYLCDDYEEFYSRIDVEQQRLVWHREGRNLFDPGSAHMDTNLETVLVFCHTNSLSVDSRSRAQCGC